MSNKILIKAIHVILTVAMLFGNALASWALKEKRTVNMPGKSEQIKNDLGGQKSPVTKLEKKIVYIVLDGVSDGENGVAEFGGKTPLEQANLPNLDKLVKQGIMGQMDTVKKGIAPQSDQAVLSILSYGEEDYPGRGIIETLGAEVDVPEGAIALRVNFATGHKEGKEIIIDDRRAGRIKELEQTEQLAQEVNSKVDLSTVHPMANFKFIPTVEHRGILIIEVPGVNLNPYVTNSDPGYTRDGLTSSALEEGTFEYKVQSITPQPKVKDNKNAQLAAQLINEFTRQSFDILEKAAVNAQRKREGKLPANLILARDACSRSSEFKTLSEKTGGMKWAMFAEVPAEFGIGKLTGMDIVRIPVSQGNWEEEYRNIATKVQETLQKYDGLYVHIKGPDLPGHDGDAQRKVNITEAIDKHFLGPLLESKALKDAVVVVTADHTTSAVKQSHTADPVPVLIVDGVTPDATVDFTEKSAKQGSLRRMKGTELLDELIAIAKGDVGAKEADFAVAKIMPSQTTALDSPTLRLDVELAGGAKGHFVVPAGTSTGVDEAKTIMNEGGFAVVERSLNRIHTAVAERKLRADQLTEIAQMMLAMGKDTLGAEATLSYQMALAWAAARQQNLENYEFIRKLAPDLASKGVPRTKIQYNITNGGEHAKNSLDLQEFMIVATGKTTAEANKMCDEIDRELGLIYQALGLKADPNDRGIGPLRGKEGGYNIEDLTMGILQSIYNYAEEFNNVDTLRNLKIKELAKEQIGVHEFVLNCLLAAIKNAGYTADTSGKPGTVALALDAASTSMLVEGHTNLYNYEGRQISSEELIKIYAEWIKKYPIDSLEDGLGENDWDGWMALIKEIGDKVLLIGDDLLVTQGGRLTKFIDLLKENGFIDDNGKVNKRLAILIKLNQNGFLTTGINNPKNGYLGTIEVIRLAKEYGIDWVVSHRSKEAEPQDNEVSIADLAAGTNAYALKSGNHVQATRGVKEDRSATIDARERALQKTERKI